jgi:hypothetical protein
MSRRTGCVRKAVSTQVQTVSSDTTSPVINTLEVWCPNKIRKHKEGEKEDGTN